MKTTRRIQYAIPTPLGTWYQIDTIPTAALEIKRITFTLREIGDHYFYECECSHGGTSSFHAAEIPDDILDEMKIHVEMRHVK